MKHTFALFALFAVFFLTGCDRALVLRTPLETGENISKDDVVFVDGKIAGRVKKVADDGGQRIAFLAITDESVGTQKMRIGVVRVLEDGRISLRTDGTDEKSLLLASGEIIPIMSKAGFTVRRVTSNKVLTVLMAGLAVVALAFVCFRRLARSWLLLLTLTLSGWIAWIALPWASDAVAKVYAFLPQTTAVASADAAQDAGTESALCRLMHNPPNSETVAYAAVFVVAFIIISMVMRSSLKRLEIQS